MLHMALRSRFKKASVLASGSQRTLSMSDMTLFRSARALSRHRHRRVLRPSTINSWLLRPLVRKVKHVGKIKTCTSTHTHKHT